MEMREVNSSNVAALDWEAETLTVRFRNGSEYEYPGVTQAQYDGLLAAPSKGKAIQGLIALRAGAVLKTSSKQSLPADPNAPIHTTQADGCCGKFLNKASIAGDLDKMEGVRCPTCDTLYAPVAHGPLVAWEAKAEILVFKL